MLQNLRGRVPGTGFAAADNEQRWVGSIGLAAVVAIAYFLAAQLSLLLLTKPDGVAVFWPAAGVAAGTLIALGPSARWPVAVGAMSATVVANLMGDRSLGGALVFALCNAGEALLTAALIERYFSPDFRLDRLRQVLGLLAASIIAAAASGIGGALGFKYFEHSTAPLLTTWHHWFASDGLGIITVAPLLIGLAAALRDPPSRSQLVEGSTALALLAAMGILIVTFPNTPWATVIPIALLFPLLLWLAARCPPVFAAAAAFITTLTIVWTTTFGIGLFGDEALKLTDRILASQAGIVAVSLCAFVLAALFAERRQHEEVLRGSEAGLQEALTAGAVTAFEWDVRTGASRRSNNAAQILGFDPSQPFSASQFLEHVHSDDRPRFQAHIRSVRPDKSSYALTFRFIRPDGQEVWLEETSRAEFDAAGRFVLLKGLTRDITERKRAEERQDMLIAEFDHRVKNILARVAVVAMYTRQGSRSMDEFIQTLDGRIQSMATAHSLLSQSRWNGAGLSDLVRHQLEPYATEANTTVQGPNVMLTAAATQAVAMVLHELVTNAAKYGALSSPRGRVSVEWEAPDGAPTLTIEWRETDGPPIPVSAQSGYGTSLIRDLIPHELGGTVTLEMPAEGVRCTVVIPFDRT
jgi:PAS domain S-box-containing protein